MPEKLNGHHLVGLFRYTPGLPKASKQKRALEDAGVDIKHHARDLNEPGVTEKIDKDCRPASENVDPICLVTPFLGALGTSLHSKILASAGRVGGILYDVETDRIFSLEEASERDEIVEACRKAQTAPGRAAAKGKGGPKKRFGTIDMIAIERDYQDLNVTLHDMCSEWDVSYQWLWNEFGGRSEAQRKANNK